VEQPALTGAEIEAAHYTELHKTYDGATFEGAIDIQRSFWDTSYPLAFTENRSLPDYAPDTVRNVNDVRAEAWEFIVGGGGLFNGYSFNMAPGITSENPTVVSAQLSGLQNLLSPYCAPYSCGGQTYASADLDTAVPSVCGAGSWCSGVLPWGSLETNGSPACQRTANVYSSAMENYGGGYYMLYVHHGTTLGAIYGFGADGFHELSCGTGSGASGFFTPLQITPPVTGCYAESWISPGPGIALSFRLAVPLTGGITVPAYAMPYYQDDVVFILQKGSGGC
jgi:hypothetical protein